MLDVDEAPKDEAEVDASGPLKIEIESDVVGVAEDDPETDTL